MTTCGALQDLMVKKTVMRNGVERYVFRDGRLIQQQQGDSMIQVIHSDEFYKQSQKLKISFNSSSVPRKWGACQQYILW